MSIVGFNLTKISSERKESFNGKLDLKSRIDIEDIKKIDMTISKDKETLQLSFVFEILYEPNFAKLLFNGNVLIMLDPKESKELLKEWKKNKKIDLATQEPVFNLILRKCNIKAFSLEEELNLPTHLPLPQLQKDNNQQKK